MKRSGRKINGVLVVDKAAGYGSNTVLQQAKRLFNAAKAGHTGSLDPAATGVLVICFGVATKFAGFLLDADKAYQSTFAFGAMTDTGDADGRILGRPGSSWLQERQLKRALKNFTGRISQVPPMYSAVKVSGRPLYQLARKGIEIEREAREVTISTLELLAFRSGESAEADLKIICSKGTYIRTLAEDLGKELGCGAHTIALRRLAAGSFSLEQSVTLEHLAEVKNLFGEQKLVDFLYPVETLVAEFPQLQVASVEEQRLRQGRQVRCTAVPADALDSGLVRLRTAKGQFIGLGELRVDGTLVSHKLI